MFCTKCGKQNKDGVRFCGYCGTPLQAGARPIRTAPSSRPVRPAPAPRPVPVRTRRPSGAGVQNLQLMNYGALGLIVLQLIFFFLPFCEMPIGALFGVSSSDTSLSIMELASLDTGTGHIFVYIGMILILAAGVLTFLQSTKPSVRRLHYTIPAAVGILLNMLIIVIQGSSVSSSTYNVVTTTFLYPLWILCALASIALEITAYVLASK